MEVINMYRYPPRSNEIYHYGIQGRSGRYPWGSGQRPYQRLESKQARMENRLKKTFVKTDKRTANLQTKVNRAFNKANMQRNSIFPSVRRRSESTFDEAYRLDEKRQRLEYRASKKYERTLKKLEKFDLEMDSDLKKAGLDYYNKVIANSDSQYKAALMKRI